MNSPTKPRGPSWIITTCRGRIAHLRLSLPSWLEHLPDWDPIVVCCDDPEAAEYARGELMLAGRGICVQTTQGQYFNKLEAIRLGATVAASGVDPHGQTFSGEGFLRSLEWVGAGKRDMVALLDADTVAIDRTWKVLASVDPSNAGIAGWGTRDDLGVLVVSLRVFSAAVKLIPIGWFEGYGPEDCALRVACWTQLKRPFLLLRPEWARKQHSDAQRTRFHSRAMRNAIQTNKVIMADLVRRIVAPEDFAQCNSDCMQWPKTGRS